MAGFDYSSKYDMWKYGLEFDAGVSVGGLFYSKNSHDMTKDALVGKTRITTGGIGVGVSYIEGIAEDGQIIVHGFATGVGVTLGGSQAMGFTKFGWGL